VSEANRQDNVTASTTPSPTRPFTAPTAGADYLATEPHYVFFAGRIVAALRHACRLAYVIGDPPPNPVVLSSALTTTAA